MIRLGLVCKFLEAPIKFRTTTATHILSLERSKALEKLSLICLDNAASLQSALAFCVTNSIGDFRITSELLPIKTHPEAGYEVDQLPDATLIEDRLQSAGAYARSHNVRLTLHPGQFTLLSSADSGVIERSVADIEYHAQVAEWVGADVINIHGGGAYGDKASALARVRANLDRLSDRARSRLTLENDDKVYTPADLLPLCLQEGTPLVYDIHHHRVLPDQLSAQEATELALSTWNREPMFHISSPRDGWNESSAYRHHDYVNPHDFPDFWKDLDLTVEVEAKAKEMAVLALLHSLKRNNVRINSPS